jgi:hypothetical protein
VHAAYLATPTLNSYLVYTYQRVLYLAVARAYSFTAKETLPKTRIAKCTGIIKTQVKNAVKLSGYAVAIPHGRVIDAASTLRKHTHLRRTLPYVVYILSS